MKKGRFLHTQKLKDHSDVGVYGVFDTLKVVWRYYVISFKPGSNGNSDLTYEICNYAGTGSIDRVEAYGKRYETKEEAIKFVEEYKIKWETASNNTTQEIRDKKLNDILPKE